MISFREQKSNRIEMKNNSLLFDIQKFCIHDGPGIRTNIFFKGCSLKCSWCANPESQSFKPELFVNNAKCIGCGNCMKTCPNHAFSEKNGKQVFDREKCLVCGKCTRTCHAGARKLYGKEYTIEEIIKEAEKDEVFYENSGGGITFSGGEPALWPDHVGEIAEYFYKKGISTAIETCGYAPWKNYERFIEYISLVMFDIKIWDARKHERYCGASNDLIFENLKKISEIADTMIRIPIIPSVNDSENELHSVAEYLKSFETINRIHLLAYHNYALGKYEGLDKAYELDNVEPPSQEHMKKIKELFESYDFSVKIGG